MNKLIVEKYFEGYKAFIEGETCRAKWGFGTSKQMAINNLKTNVGHINGD